MTRSIRETLDTSAKKAFDAAGDMVVSASYVKPGKTYDPATRTLAGADTAQLKVRALPSAVSSREVDDVVRITDIAYLFICSELTFTIDLEGYFLVDGVRHEIVRKQGDASGTTIRVVMRAAN